MQPLNYTMFRRILNRGTPQYAVPSPFGGKYPTKMVLARWEGQAYSPCEFYFGAPSLARWKSWVERFRVARSGTWGIGEVDRRGIVSWTSSEYPHTRGIDLGQAHMILTGQRVENAWLKKVYHAWGYQDQFGWLGERWEVRTLATGIGPMRFYVPERIVAKGSAWMGEYRKQFGTNPEYERELQREMPGNPWRVGQFGAGNAAGMEPRFAQIPVPQAEVNFAGWGGLPPAQPVPDFNQQMQQADQALRARRDAERDLRQAARDARDVFEAPDGF